MLKKLMVIICLNYDTNWIIFIYLNILISMCPCFKCVMLPYFLYMEQFQESNPRKLIFSVAVI